MRLRITACVLALAFSVGSLAAVAEAKPSTTKAKPTKAKKKKKKKKQQVQGIQGPAGAQGPAGQQGSRGPAGPQEPAGQQGATGQQGAAGQQGPQGPAGPSGVTQVTTRTQFGSSFTGVITVTARCEAGEVVVGGGFIPSGLDTVADSSAPTAGGDGWSVIFFNPRGGTAGGTTIARCARA